jgi:hypothetical protein
MTLDDAIATLYAREINWPRDLVRWRHDHLDRRRDELSSRRVGFPH